MRILIILFLLIIASLSLAAEDLYIVVGEAQQVVAPRSATIHVKPKDVVAIKDLGAQLKIVGLKTGTAILTMGEQRIVIHVLDRKLQGFHQAIFAKIKTFMGLHAELNDGKIFITGSCYRFSDWLALSEVAREFDEEFIFRARPDEDVKADALKYLQRLMRESNLPTPRIVWTPGARAFIAEDLKHLASYWDATLKPLGIERAYEKSELAIQPLVRVKIVVAEVNKKVEQKLGIQWPDVISAQVAPKLLGPSSLEIMLKALESQGQAQILASPNLLARSGSEAEFLAGGEIPIKILTPRVHEVIWKRHGIYLKIKPKADYSGRLSIELTTEISLIDGSQSYDGIPALKTNRMSTHFDLSEPHTIVLSGLIRNDWGKDSGGIPFLSRLPILGPLFRSDDFYNMKSELVIFVTPEIINDRDSHLEPTLPKGYENHADFN